MSDIKCREGGLAQDSDELVDSSNTCHRSIQHRLQQQAQFQLDAQGLYCPEPVMLLHNKVREMPAGAKLLVVATDPSTKRDIPKFCQFLGHELILSQQQDTHFYYLIKKAQ